MKWEAEIEALRVLLLGCGLTEEVKWGAPCFTYEGRNIVILNGMKDYCAVGFFKGALLADAFSVLVRPGEHTHEGRLVRIGSTREVAALASVLRAYVYEAIEVEKAGLSVARAALTLPLELSAAFDRDPLLRDAFFALTPGRQRGYALFFGSAKQSATRVARIERYTPHIMKGKGHQDR